MKQHGFTLLELMIVVVIIAITASVGVPSFRDTIRNQRISTLSNELLTSVSQARAAAIQQNTNVVVCMSKNPDDNPPVCEDTKDWSAGWVVLADSNRDGAFENKLSDVRISHPNMIVKTNGAGQVQFARTGLPVGFNNATYSICDERKADTGHLKDMRTLVISASGRAKVEIPESGELGC